MSIPPPPHTHTNVHTRHRPTEQAIATSGRPGPVLVDLPKDVTSARLMESPDCTPRIAARMLEKARLGALPTDATEAVLDRVVKLINGAERPIIYAGQGVISSGAVEALRELAARGNIPVTTTLLGARARCSVGGRGGGGVVNDACWCGCRLFNCSVTPLRCRRPWILR